MKSKIQIIELDFLTIDDCPELNHALIKDCYNSMTNLLEEFFNRIVLFC